MSVYQVLGGPVPALNLRQLVRDLEERISKDPANPHLFLQAAETLDAAGFFQKAYSFARTAQTLDPGGSILMEFRRRRYNDHHHEGEGCSVCDAICGLCLLDSCCECMGGDIIECC